MTRRAVIIVFILGSLTFLTPKNTYAFDPFSIVRILTSIRTAVRSVQIPNSPSVTVPFGGRIVESGTACKLHYWMSEPPFYIPHPGFPIPLFGSKIRVATPGIPISNVFTFPGITQIYANKHEDRVGVWTLGISSKKNFVNSIINTVNSTLSRIPPIIVGPVTFFNFSLSCPDGGIILKIGTS